MKKLRKKDITWLSLAIVAFMWAGQQYGWFDTVGKQAEQSQPGLYSVSRFIDGDTIAITMNGKSETVRMIGVDTPETHKPNTPVQCYGPAAAAYTKNLIGAQQVRLEADPKNQNRDRYGRLLRYVYVADGRMVEKELIANGYGFAYTSFPFSKTEEFVSAEDTAKLASKGLWGNCNVTEDAGRKQTNVAG